MPKRGAPYSHQKFTWKKAAIGAGQYMAKNAIYNGLNTIAPGSGFAAQAAVAAGKKAFAAGRKMRENHKKLLRLRGGAAPIKKKSTATGVYVGKFKKPTSKFPGRKEGKALKKGYEVGNETYGSVTDDHSVYITHSTQNLDAIVEVICGALVRKLFMKAGIPVNNTDQEMPLQYYNNSNGFVITFSTRDFSSVENPPYMEVAIPNNTTFKSLMTTQIANMKTFFKDYIRNFFDARIPYYLCLYSKDETTLSTSYRLASQINLENETIHMYCSSSIMVQNRTAGQVAGAGDLSNDRVDNQPLKGWLYEFKHGTPRLRQTGVTGTDIPAGNTNASLAVIQHHGTRLLRSTDLPADYENLPNPRVFSNVQKASKILLNPGQMKRIGISHKFVGKVPNLIAKLRSASEANASFWSMIPGRSQTIALEEALRTDSANKIYVNYEVHQKISAYCVSKQNNYILPEKTTVSYSLP